jgi:hypothetical protein
LAGNLKFRSSVVNIDQRTGLGTSLRKDRIGLLASLEWTVVGTLAILVILGLALRLNQLGALGFAEDETNKLDAVQSYEAGDFSTNAEHPMVMKVLMLASTNLAPSNSVEVALRVPNVLIGALTVVPLFLLAAAFFDRWTALLAAAFWAFGINAITHNRIGKEDTLLVFFMLFAFYFFLRAKQTSPVHKTVRHRNYAMSAVAFGLMIASKYFPHYLGLNMLYHHNFRVRKAAPGEPSGRTPGWFYLLIIGVFLVANPAVLLPHVWQYLNAYLGEHLLTHSGYLIGDQLYKNNMSSSPFWGTPLYFYALFLAIKVPLLIVGGFVIGLIVAVARRRHPGHIFLIFMFLFWIVPYSLIGGKWLRYTLSLMPFVYMLAAVGVAAVTRAVIARFPNWKHASMTFSAIAVIVFVGVPAITAVAHGPHYALYTNALASDKAGYYFPHDEFYDDGLREGIKYVCDVAPAGATIAHETPAVARYYLAKFGRSDLKSYAISAKDFNPTTSSGTVYVIVQRGRTYFENQEEVASVRSTFKKVHEVRIEGLTAVEVFVNQ